MWWIRSWYCALFSNRSPPLSGWIPTSPHVQLVWQMFWSENHEIKSLNIMCTGRGRPSGWTPNETLEGWANIWTRLSHLKVLFLQYGPLAREAQDEIPQQDTRKMPATFLALWLVSNWMLCETLRILFSFCHDEKQEKISSKTTQDTGTQATPSHPLRLVPPTGALVRRPPPAPGSGVAPSSKSSSPELPTTRPPQQIHQIHFVSAQNQICWNALLQFLTWFDFKSIK